MAARIKKLSAAAIGVPLSIFIAWLIPLAGGPDIPAEIAAAGGAVITQGVSLLIPDRMEA